MFQILKKLIFLQSFFLIFLNFSHAQFVKKLEINGNDRISTETIKVFASVDLNKNYDENDLNDLLRRLDETNFFRDISILIENNVLKIYIKENPIIEKITYKGVKSNKLKDAVFKNLNLRNKASFNEFLLNKDKDKIRNSLNELGYFFSKINTYIENLEDNKVNIIYEIELNQKAKIKKISFIGDKIFKDRRLRNLIISEEYKFWKFISGRKFLNEKNVTLDERLLKNFYLNKGYFEVKINSSFAKIINENDFELIFNIDAGNKFYFNNLTLKIPPDYEENNFSDLVDLLNNMKDVSYSLFAIDKILDEIDKITISEQFESVKTTVVENITDNRIDLTFQIEETEKFFIEKINIFGNNITRENVIRNQFLLDEGDPYNDILYNKTINKIKSLNFFKSVNGEIKNGNNFNSKVINFSVEEKPTGEITAGAGFGTSGGTVAFGVRENNYLGKGIKLDSSITINTESVKGNLYVQNPNFQNTDKSIFFNLEATELDRISQSGYKSSKTGVSLGTNFEYLSNLNLSLATSNYFEKMETDSTASVLQKKQTGNYYDSYINFKIDYDKRNQTFKTSDGFRSIYSMDIPLISETKTINTTYDYKYFTELYEDNITSFSFFASGANSFDDNIRLSERLFLPGNKLRGFERGKVGPKDGLDFVGGNFMSGFSISTTLPTTLESLQNLDIIAFTDIANLWGVDYNSSLDDKNEIRSSIGIGIDWYSMLGPLNFTLAYPITKSSTDITETFRFNIGTSF